MASLSILVVDGDRTITRPLQSMLTQAGYRVSLAPGGLEALGQLAQKPNLIILAATLPDYSWRRAAPVLQTVARLPPHSSVGDLRRAAE